MSLICCPRAGGRRPGARARRHAVAAGEPDQAPDPGRGDDVDPFAGGAGGAEELADAGASACTSGWRRALTVSAVGQQATRFESGDDVARIVGN